MRPMPSKSNNTTSKSAQVKSIPSAERILNLLVLLTESSVPLTLDQIFQKMAGQYVGTEQACRTSFERDKAVLRSLGVPVVTHTLAGNDAGKGAYTIDKSEYALVDYGLTDSEMDALQQAASVVQMGTTWGARAVQWLGGEVVDQSVPTTARIDADDTNLPQLFAASTARAIVTFDYHGKKRTVHPYGLIARNGFWYLVCHDTDRNSQVVYRVDRIDGEVETGQEGAFERPAGFALSDAHGRDAKRFGVGDEELATVWVDARLVPGVIAELGEEAVRARLPDGSAEVRVPSGNRVAFRTWLFAMVDRAAVLAPSLLRQEIVDELTAMSTSSRPTDSANNPSPRTGSSRNASVEPSTKPKRGPRSAEVRVRGLLHMLPWLMQREEVAVSDMAQQFSMSEEDLIADLEMASMCGLPPYTPLELTEIYIDEGIIHVGPNKHMERRLRLTPAEAFGLSLLASAADDIPGFARSAELDAAIGKLKQAVPDGVVDVEVDSPEFLEMVTTAAVTGEKLRIVYWTPARNAESERVIGVRAVFSDRGHWYITADDERTSEVRYFRVDRIRSVEATGTFIGKESTSTATPVIPEWFADAEGMTVARLLIPASASWVIETYPCRHVVENDDGSFVVEMVVANEHWLGRLLLRVGEGVRVEAPAEWVDLRARTAHAVLSRYLDSAASA